MLHARVAAGEYATESEMISDGLLSLVARDYAHNYAMEEWLTAEVLPAYDALQANPDHAIPLSDVRKAVASEQAKSMRR